MKHAILAIGVAAVLVASCGGKERHGYKLPDGGTAMPVRGAFCQNWTFDQFRTKYVSAKVPTCDPLIGSMQGDNSQCTAWVAGLSLPLLPQVLCPQVGMTSVCTLGPYFSPTEVRVECDSTQGADADQFCSEFFGQLVQGEGDAVARCGGGNVCVLGYGCPCTLFPPPPDSTEPPSPQVCVSRNSGLHCETWCQSPP